MSRLLSRLSIIPRAIGRRCATLGRRRPPDSPHRILVAHHLRLGDTLMLTPLLAKLRARYPAAAIVMTCPKAIVPLYVTRPYGVEAIAFDPRDPSTLQSLLQIAKDGFDLAVVPGENRYAWLALALGSRWIVAFAGERPAYKNWPVDRLIVYPKRPAAWGDMVTELVDGAPPPRYRATDWVAPPSLALALPPVPYVVLHVGAGTPLRQWEPAKWRALAEWLVRRGLAVVWSGGPDEAQIVADIDADGRYPSLAGKLDLPQLWRLLAGAKLLVCPDTGVSHLGRVVGVPTATLFGPGSSVIFGKGDFWGDSPYEAVTVEDFPCRDQRVLFKREIDWVRRCGRSPDECPAPRCMQAIGEQQVQNAIADLLEPRQEAHCD